MKGFLQRTTKTFEKYIPMTLWGFIQFIFVLYLIIVVGKTVYTNYNSNKQIVSEEAKLVELTQKIHYLENQINYYQTYSFKEKEARAKLGYKAPGESILSLPIDTAAEKVEDGKLAEAQVRVPNYQLWWQYFFQ
jgi:cell division protein FtsB